MYYESDPYALNDPQIKAIGVALVSEFNGGTAYFDDIVLKEFDENGTFVQNVYEQDLEDGSGWFFWKAGSTGAGSVSLEAHSGDASLAISGTDHDANFAGSFRYVPKPGHRYAVGGWMKGSAISNDSRPDPRGAWTQVSRALIRLDYFTADGPVTVRDKASLETQIDRTSAWAIRNQVPLYLGEFGVMHQCFENGRGGATWVKDMLDIIRARGIHFTYHSYHEPGFGIFLSEPTTTLPDSRDANQALIDVFTAELATR
jgi:endoglucanase